MTDFRFGLSPRTFFAAAGLLVLAGCAETMSNVASVFDRGSQDLVVQTAPRPEPDDRGVLTYPTYQVAVARDGDTVASIAERVGVPADALARRNGFPISYRPLAGELLALPQYVGGILVGTNTRWTPELAANAINNSASGSNPFSNGSGPDGAIEPQRHKVQRGETAFTIARKYNVSVTALASWNGLDSKLNVRPGQELLIPVPASRRDAVAQPRSASAITATALPGTVTPVAPPPSASKPLPEDIAAVETPPSPNLGEDRTSASGGRFLAPVTGSIVKPYSTAPGPGRNEGIDFAAAAGATVRAADDGEVALISRATGDLGTIVLIRHSGGLLTVYGRVGTVSVKKGDRVKRGQKIGVVANGSPPTLHFEVRRGTESVDPTPFL